MKRTVYTIFLLLLCHTLMAVAASQPPGAADSVAKGTRRPSATTVEHRQGRTYTAAQPLIYEDSWEKWPYAYLSDDGAPKGFNVELVTRMMRRLRVPFLIKLRRQERVHEDLMRDSADLSLGVATTYNSPFGHFGHVTICHFTNSMLVPRADSTGSITTEALCGRKIIVRRGSRPLAYLSTHGFPDSVFTVVDNMETEILREASAGRGGAIWNTMMMKWVIHKYHLGDRYVAVPIDMPDGEYRFMSGDTVLLARLDSLCRVMKQEGEIDRLLEKWLYPERADTNDSFVTVMLILIAATIVAILVFGVLRRHYNHYSRNTLTDVRSQMQLVLHSNKMRVWVYFPKTRRYAWMSSDGEVDEYHSSFEFSRFYPDGDFNVIHTHVMECLSQDQPPVTENIRCYSLTEPDKVIDVEVRIQELRDEYGKPYLVCGVQYDITDSKAAIGNMRLLRDRYRTAFQMAHGTVMRFSGDKLLVGLNEIGMERFGISDPGRFFAEGYNISEVDLLEGIDIDNCPDDLRFTHFVRDKDIRSLRYARSKYFNAKPYAFHGYYYYDVCRDSSTEGYYYVHLNKSVDMAGKVISYMLYIYDKTEEVLMAQQLAAKRRQTEFMEEQKAVLRRRRDYTLQSTGIWMVCYNPGTKDLTIYDRNANRQPPYSQVSLLEYVDGGDIKKVFKVFRKLDSRHRGSVTLSVKTYLVNAKGENRHFHFDVRPDYGENGEVLSYFGTCRDVTATIYARKQLEEETKLVMEAEMVKGNFLKNTSYSLRQPLISIQQTIRMLGQNVSEQVESELVGNITSNIRRLTTLSDDTLLLSRIEAGLVTVKRKPVDFCKLFRETTEQAIDEFRSAAVTYTVQDVYDSLMLQLDPYILTRILHEVVSLSARYTRVGTLAVRYVYRKDTLTLVVEDTGQGIPPSIFRRIFEPHIGEDYTMQEQGKHLSGLEIPICKALVNLVGGDIDIDSDPGRGTTTYVQLNVAKAEEQGTAHEEEMKKNNIV